MARRVDEWIGKTPDTKVPPHVRLRIFRAHDGKCHLTGRKITPADAWDLDHVIALINGGEHRESNLAPALRDKHREKTAEDVKAKARGDKAAMRAAGIKRTTTNWPKRPMRGNPSNARQLYGDLEEAEQ
jgi:5-methylcytosine-specific restriction protein A